MFTARRTSRAPRAASSPTRATLYALLTGRVSRPSPARRRSMRTPTQYSFLGKRRRAGKLNNYSAFVQDSWRMTPTLTLNAGLRWDVQTPFSPINDTMSAATPGRCLRRLRSRRRRHLHACKFFTPGASGGKVPEFVAVHERHARLQHRLEQRLAERRRRVAAEGGERLAPHDPRRSRAGHAPRRLLRRVRAAGLRRVHRRVRSAIPAAR